MSPSRAKGLRYNPRSVRLPDGGRQRLGSAKEALKKGRRFISERQKLINPIMGRGTFPHQIRNVQSSYTFTCGNGGINQAVYMHANLCSVNN